MLDQNINHRRARLLVVIFIFLTSAYMLTYSGRIVSTDTLFLLDATGSLVRYRDLRLDISAGVRPPPPDQLQTGEGFAPLPDVDAEPLQIVLAAPLYWLAEQLPAVGLAHTVYLLNILVSAAAGSLIYVYALVLGYDLKVGVVAALLFGLATIVWPYSKTFFQEPLTLLLILATALWLEMWRRAGYKQVGWLVLAGIAGMGAVLSKRAALLALPALVVLAAPNFAEGRSQRQIWQRAGLIVAVGLALAAVLLIASEPLGIAGRIDRALRIIQRPGMFAGVALHSYLLSIGGSVWGTSPVILLALPGAWLLHRQSRYRYTLALILMLALFALVYALWQGRDWFGGLSWPPRFLIPVIPFAVLVTLPVLDRVLHRRVSYLWKLATILLVVYSVWVQLSGVTLAWSAYSAALPPEAGGLGEWGGGLNLLRYLRWVILPSLWSTTPLDIAWLRLDIPLWLLVFGLLMILSGYMLWQGRYPQYRLNHWRLMALVIGLVLAIWLGLRAAFDDPLYQFENDPLWAMMPMMAAETQPDDVVLLSDLAYERFFTNYGRRDLPRIVSLPFQPGEQPSPQQAPEVVSENPDALVHKSTAPLIFALAEARDRLWLLSSSGPFLPWSVRPVERFLATHYYAIREMQTDPKVRLIEYSTIHAPDPFAMIGPTYAADLVYDDGIRLLGYELPAGTTYAPGDVLPVSLYWQTDMPLTQDYKVAWFVRDTDGQPVIQGWDLEPGGGFAHTTSWQVGVPVWDNRAIRLPADVLPGEYRLWVVMYTTDLEGNIVNLPVRGSDIADEHIGVLPTVIAVRE